MTDPIKKIFYKQRMDFEASTKQRDKELPFPKNVDEIKDIYYSDDHLPAHRLDIFRPADRKSEVLPVIINIHGGGLLMGSKEFNRFFCARLCKTGYMVYSIEYRLVPDCSFFDQLNDVFMAMDYIKQRIADDYGDTANIYACADSGGACLLTYASAMIHNNKLANAAGIKPASIKLNAIGFISGMFYTNRFDKIGLFLPKYLYGRHYKKEAFAPYINPECSDITEYLPPVFMVTSHNDNLRHYTTDFAMALKKHNACHKLINFPKKSSLTHAFSVFEPFLPESTKTIRAMITFFKQYSC